MSQYGIPHPYLCINKQTNAMKKKSIGFKINCAASLFLFIVLVAGM